MCLEITKARVGVAIAKHRSNRHSIRKHDPLPYQTPLCDYELRNLRKELIYQELSKIAASERVCGVLVGWPLEPSGLPGSRCGQVLHLLDYLAERQHEGTSMINNNSRPVVLWDERMFTHKQFEEESNSQDEWGRCQVFGKKTDFSPKGDIGDDNGQHFSHRSSLRSDHPTSDDSAAASSIMEQFLNQHSLIFEINQNNELRKEQSTGNDFRQIIEEIDSHGIHMKPSLL